jgi:signal peptide peptidase SppA
MKPEHINPACASMHLNRWLVLESWLESQVSAFKAGMLPVRQPMESAQTMPDESGRRPWPNYRVDGDGIATLNLSGAMLKRESKFVDSTSTAMARQAVRLAMRDGDVKGMMLMIDSPGGTVDGTDELAADLRVFANIKPLHSHAESTMASAAYWLGIQADRVSATRLTDVGSIGVMMRIMDTSGKYAADGIKVHVIKSGPDKAAFVDGAPVTNEMLALAQEGVDEVFAAFRAEVKGRRNMNKSQVDDVSTGRVWSAVAAKPLGLIDAVEEVDAAYDNLRKAVRQRAKASDDRRAKRAEIGGRL